jgi:aminomethyltransferase
MTAPFGAFQHLLGPKLADGAGGALIPLMAAQARTPLYDFHASHGARFVDFAGWDMPVQYRSILEEHRAVRQAAGLFDVSHMGEAVVNGPAAEAFLNWLLTNDIAKAQPGQAIYTMMCQPDGGVIDDLIVYRLAADSFLLCLNASNRAVDVAWLQEQSAGRDVQIRDLSDEYGLLALQGPRSEAILQRLTATNLPELKYYRFVEGAVNGITTIISRTGYTGEDGFELFCPAGEAASLAEALFDAGQADGLQLAGLGARDSLRLEAGFSLYGHEISREINPIAANLGWTVKFNKGCDFIGRDALLKEKEAGPARRIVFFRTGDRRIARAGAAVGAADETVGQVTSGAFSPLLNEAIGSALVSSQALAQAAPLWVDLRGQRQPLQVAKPPFVTLRKPGA